MSTQEPPQKSYQKKKEKKKKKQDNQNNQKRDNENPDCADLQSSGFGIFEADSGHEPVENSCFQDTHRRDYTNHNINMFDYVRKTNL